MIEKDLHIFSYKDESPLNTVRKIKDILGKYDVKVTESWWDAGVPNCYIVMVSVDGTSFRTTGKGLTRELALASGYGELMERFQLGHIGRKDVQKDGNFSTNDVQSEVVSARSLLERNGKWYEIFSDRLQTYVGKKYSSEDILMQYADADGNVVCTPYYSITTDSKEYLPTALRKAVYTASGCASGNTAEEAIVHAISEIIERYSLVKIASENITPPDVPEEVLKQFKCAYSIISYIREHGYKVVVKDCSLGNKYPVISVCYINRKNGRYHTHYGADPVLEIAIERALIEPFQGRSIEHITKHTDFALKTEKRLDVKNLEKEVVWGAAEKPYFFFTGEPTYEYNDKVGLEGRNNKELLKECVSYFKKMGYDIIVRDGSCLGFPTYQVIIPGYSEVACHRMAPDYKDDRIGIVAAKALKDLSRASFDELVMTLMYMGEKNEAFSKLSGLHLKIEKNEENYLKYSALAYINYSLMRYSETIKYIDILLSFGYSRDEDYLICLKRYFTISEQKDAPKDIRKILEYFHSQETVEKLFSYLNSNGNPFNDFVVHCDNKCSEECCLYKYCCKKYVSSLIRLINEKTKELDYGEFSEGIRRLMN